MVNGQAEDISVVRANFDAIAAAINGVDNNNIPADANISLSKLASNGTIGNSGVTVTGAGGLGLTGITSSTAGYVYTPADPSKAGFVVSPQGEATSRFAIGGDGTLTWALQNQAPGPVLRVEAGFQAPPVMHLSSEFRTDGNIVAGYGDLSKCVRIGTINPGQVPGIRFGENLRLTMPNPTTLSSEGNFSMGQLQCRQGADLAVAGNALAPTASLHRITANPGNANVSNITGGVDGAIVLFVNRTGALFYYDTTGNILPDPPGGNTAPHGIGLTRGFIYIASEGKWQAMAQA
jgi:hypothetical protein